MKLADLGLKKVYCVVYEQDGKVLTTYEEKHMNRILELYSGKCVEVYNPHGLIIRVHYRKQFVMK